MSDFDQANPKFITWLNAQSTDTKAAVTAQQAVIAAMPDISHFDPIGAYARLERLMKFCADTYGYPFP